MLKKHFTQYFTVAKQNIILVDRPLVKLYVIVLLIAGKFYFFSGDFSKYLPKLLTSGKIK